MDRLRQLIVYVNSQMSLLTVSQRLAIGLCAALIAGSLLWLLQWSTQPDLTPLLSKDLTYAEMDAAETSLKANKITYEVHGTRIFVSPAERHNALRVAHSAGAIPEGSLFDMEAMIKNQNPFQSPEAREYAQNYAKGNELAKILSTSPAVKSASVIVNPRSKRRLGGQSDTPTASVSVTLASGVEMSPEMVESFAKLVSGAVAGLKPYDVAITDARTLRSFSVPRPQDAAPFDYMQLVKQREAHLRAKILNKLADIPGAQVEVTVELDTSKRVTQNVRHDSPQPKTETRESSENSAAAQPTEPGVQPNLGQAVTASAAGQNNTTENSSVENFEPKVSQTETIEHLPYATKSVAAAVGIPRSFVAGIFGSRFPEKKDPKDDDPDFTAVRDEQIARVKRSIERIVLAKGADDVVVDVYPDMEWTPDGGTWSRAPGGIASASAVGPAEGSDTLSLMRTYGPQVGLGVLAMTSLFMMLRIVKKATPSGTIRMPTVEVETPPEEEPILSVGSHAVGQAEVSASFLTGREVDDDTLRYQELSREVSKLVQQDPEGAAELVRRWIEDAE